MNEEEMFDREVMDRAIRRLNVLEYVILGAAALLALLGGAVVAWILSSELEVSFRLAWVVSSLLLFVVPGALVYAREKLSTTGTDAGHSTRRTGDVDG